MKDNPIVYKANLLINASFSLTLNEKRLLLAAISQIPDPRKPISRDDEFTITAVYFSRLFKLKNVNNTYLEISEAATSLLSKVVTIEKSDPDNPKLSRTKTGWVSFADYYDGEGKVVIKFSEKILPYLSSLTSGCFSKFSIEQISKLKSVYAIRLFELLISEAWKNQDYEIEISRLKYIFDIHDEYERLYDFKRYILEPSLKSINEHTDCKVTYTQRKNGREVVSFIFNYSIATPDKPQPITRELIEKHARPGESYEQVRLRLSKPKLK